MKYAATPPGDDKAEDMPRGEGARMFDVLNALRCLPAATLDPTARHVLLILVTHMSPKPRARKRQPAWSAYPSGMRLALETGYSRSTVHAALGRITEAGLIGHLGRAKDILAPSETGRDPESILYGLNVPFVMKLAEEGRAQQKRILTAAKAARKAARSDGRKTRTDAALDDFAVSDRQTPEVAKHRSRTDQWEQTNLCNEGRDNFQKSETHAREVDFPQHRIRENGSAVLDGTDRASGAATISAGSELSGGAVTETGRMFAAFYANKARAKGGNDAP